MDWMVIITMILEMIEKCFETDDRTTIERRLRNPGLRETWALRRTIRDQTELRGRELHAAVREGITTLKAMDDTEIAELLNEVAGK